MSVNTIRPPRAATHGIVGPQSGADPEARLRRLLMMGTKERDRAMQQATGTCLGAQHPSVATGAFIEVSEDDLNPPHVLQTDDGVVTISTTPGMWSGMTVKQVVKLKLNPANPEDLKQKSFKDILFSSPYCNHRFFVYSCRVTANSNAIAYYVLVRPPDDPRVYTFK